MAEADPSFPAAISLNRTALQAIYYAVTGKTENISKDLKRNVIITHADFQQLYHKINQQIHHYHVVTEPSVSIVVKWSSSETVQYSSWERFSDLELNSQAVTSEVSIKFEMLLQLPLTPQPQRCAVNVSLDSGLPVIMRNPSDRSGQFLDFMIFFASEQYTTAQISINFVDFLLARVLIGVIEEWFSTLDNVPKKRMTSLLLKNNATINLAVNQFGRIGMAAFLASYVWLHKGSVGDYGKFVYSLSIALCWWSLFSILVSYFRRQFGYLLSASVLPSVILFTAGDAKAYSNVKNHMAGFYKSISGLIWVTIANVAINVLSSYIYTYLTEQRK